MLPATASLIFVVMLTIFTVCVSGCVCCRVDVEVELDVVRKIDLGGLTIVL